MLFRSESCTVVRASLTGARDALKDLQDLQAASRNILNGISGYVNTLEHSRKDADDAYQSLAATVEQMELVSRQQSNYLKTVSSVQADLTRVAGAMEKSADAVRASAASIESAHIHANQALQDELSATLDAYRDYVNQFTQRVDYLASNIAGALQQMPDAVTDANNRFLDQVDRLSVTMGQAQRALEDAIDRLYRG